ncbi:MAG: guanylate kinase [Desulfobacteraceae bacterium]
MEKHTTRKGLLIVISAPSGTGKTTLCRLLMDQFKGISYSVSHTTRKPRAGEIHGTDYHFVTVEEFERMIANQELVEWAKVHDNYYGTSLGFIQQSLDQGRDILLDIDVQGAANIRAAYPEAVTVFIMPPSMEALRERLGKRGTDSPEVIEKRIKNAVTEMEQKDLYRHVIVNDNLETAKNQLFSIVRAWLEPTGE